MEYETISMLNQAIFECDTSRIEAYEDLLSKYIKGLAKNEDFFNLPIENFLNIIRKSKCKDPRILKSLSRNMNKYRKEDAPLILKAFDVDASDLSLLDCEKIIGNLKCCPICKLVHDIIKRDKNLPIKINDKQDTSLIEENNSLRKEISKQKDMISTLQNQVKSDINLINKRDVEIKDLNEKLSKLNAVKGEEKPKDETVPKKVEEKPKDETVPKKVEEKPKDETVPKKVEEKSDEKPEEETVFPIVDEKPDDFIDSITEAAKNGKLTSVIYLVEKCHVDAETRDKDGWTPLILASLNGNFDIVKYLVEKCHADIHAKETNHGWTPFSVSKLLGHMDIATYILREHIKNPNGELC